MDTGLSIAASGLAAATTEIAVTAENISNAQTPGYVAEQAQLAAQAGDSSGVGDGVVVTSISQVNDALLAANNLQAQGSLSNLSALQQVLTGIQNVFPLGQSSSGTDSTTDTSSNTSIAGQLADFWSAWDDIAQDPTSPAPSTEVVDYAQGLVTSLNEASTQLSQLASDTSGEIADQVSQVNALLQQAASLNQQIVATNGGGGNAAQLVDDLNNITGQLATSAGVNVQMQSNGTALVSIGGVAVVQDDSAATLAISTAGGTTSITTSGGAVTVPVTSGSLAGLLTGVNQTIPQYGAELDGVANALASTVNGQLAQGVTTSDVSGATLPLFTANGGTTTPTSVTAATISINPTIAADPADLAVASTPSTPGAQVNDGSNAAAMAELSNVSTGPDVAYQQLIEQIGSDTQNVDTQVTAQTSVANQAQQALQSQAGVNENTELTNLMQFQSSYQASAKLVNVIDSVMQSLLTAV